MKSLQKIAEKYAKIDHNEDNYSIGGGLDGGKFASRRHEDANNDPGKLTEGKATQLFKKATGLDLDYVKAIINYAVPCMEWHHAGKLPKAYGGGMKKTYFLNAKEIVEIATNWDSYCEKYELSQATNRKIEEEKKALEERKQAYLNEYGVRKVRVTSVGQWFYETNREMDGKYGWFVSYGKSYNMTEYLTGWEFDSEEKYRGFFEVK